MKKKSALLAICGGIHWSPVNYPHKGQCRGALMVSLICAWINGWVNNGESGDLRCHRSHYDVTVKIYCMGDGASVNLVKPRHTGGSKKYYISWKYCVNLKSWYLMNDLYVMACDHITWYYQFYFNIYIHCFVKKVGASLGKWFNYSQLDLQLGIISEYDMSAWRYHVNKNVSHL